MSKLELVEKLFENMPLSVLKNDKKLTSYLYSEILKITDPDTADGWLK